MTEASKALDAAVGRFKACRNDRPLVFTMNPDDPLTVGDLREWHAALRSQPGKPDREEVAFGYTNWRGENSERRVAPISIRYGTSDYHSQAGWLLFALDLDKNEHREFSMRDMHWLKPADAILSLTPSHEAPAQPDGLEHGHCWCGLHVSLESQCDRCMKRGNFAEAPAQEPVADEPFEQSIDVQTDYERGVADGIAKREQLAQDVMAGCIADELEIQALQARLEDYKRRLAALPASHATREALEKIAGQKTCDEIAAEGDGLEEEADFVGAYDALILIARAATRADRAVAADESAKP
jgi:hypothetical protein